MSTPSEPDVTPEETPSIGVAVLDHQHQELAERAKALYEAVETGKPRGLVLARLTGFYNQMRSHFASEEQILRLHKCPDFARHKGAHEGLVELLSLVRQQVASGGRDLNLGLVELMKLWLLEHIEEHDSKDAKSLGPPDRPPRANPTEEHPSQ